MKRANNKFQTRKRPILGIVVIVLMLCLMAGQAYTLDYPHNAVNNVNCDSCHLISGANATLLVDVSSHSTGLDDSTYNNLCWGCHNDTDAPEVQTHSYLQIDADYGQWSVECRTCHNPHTQRQVKTYTTSTYLTTGTSTSITTNTLTDTAKSWTDDEFIGLSVIPDTGYRRLGYKITDNTSNTLTVDGVFDTTYITSGDTYAVVYGKLIKETIATDDILVNSPTTKGSGDKTVRFYTDTGTNSFADTDATYDGVCQVCHTMTEHFRNDGGGAYPTHNDIGGQAGNDCINCHSHTGGFAHGSGASGAVANCVKCHGHDSGTNYDPDGSTPFSAGGAASQGKGTYVAHSTHTETDSDDLRGPGIYCNTCHDIDSMPNFRTVADADANVSLAATDICDACHSSGGTYDGVDDATVGAKNNWSASASATSLIYNGAALQSGKEKWCATCHDESASVISSITAPNVIGDEDNSGGDGIYGNWGYYKSGHGLSASSTYDYSGGVTSGAGKECLDCHDSTVDHTDADARTFDCIDGCDSTEYRTSYRLQQVNGYEPMEIPWTGSGGSDATKFRLCTQGGCHNSVPFITQSATENTNFYTTGSDGYKNRHQYHLRFSNSRYRADYDFTQSVNSRINCVICHNVHGSTQLAMVRDGKLINREPGLKIWYHDDPAGGACCEGTVAWVNYNTSPPDPEDLPLSASTGTIWRGATSANLCSHCHANNNTIEEYRDPYQDVSQAPTLDWTGETNYVSDGVNPNSALAETTFAFKIKYTDTNNDSPSSIQVWLDRNDDGDYLDTNEKIDMDELDSGDTNRTDGKVYSKTITISKAGDSTFTYKFDAADSSAGTLAATGNAPVTTGGTVSVTDNAPTLSWTGETYFASDGVNPDTGGNGAIFEFRVKYTDLDSFDGCPASGSSNIQVWVDEDDSGVYDADEKFNLTEDSSGDTDCTNGKIYKYSKTLAYTNDGIYNYRFYATGGGAAATGDPVSDNTVTVVSSSNNPPLLEWYSGNCLSEGIRPSTGAGGTEYEFMVKYSDADAGDGCPTGSNIQVWVDKNDDGDYLDANEKINLTEDDAGDTDCTDGKIYKDTELLDYNGDGVLNYRYFAYDGTADATGTPVSDTTVTVLNGYTVRPSGSSLTYNYTSIDTAVDSETGTYIVVYPNDDFTAATYSERVTLYWSSGHDLTVQSACGADLTTISSSDGGTTIVVQDVSNAVFDGFSITGATSGYGIDVNRIDSTSFTVRNSKIYSNQYGIVVNDGDYSPVKIENSEIYSNSVRGIHLPNGYASDIRISDSVIHSHNGSSNGAGIYLNTGSSAVISRSVIRDNVTTGEGGAIYTNLGNLTIENSIFADNTASYGGVIRTNNGPTVSIVNSTFADNTASYGGVFYICATGTTTVRNSVFWNNTASVSGNIAHKGCSAYNGFLTITDSNLSTSGGNFANGTPTVSDNITPAENPLFVNATSDNYHIQSGSPMIDQASATYAPADDIDGDSRPRDAADDIGADEYVPGSNNLPGLEWTGETNYTSDGVNPDSAAGGSNFVFRVKYTDLDNEAPSTIQLWVDTNDDGDYLDTNEKLDMTIDGGDGNYTNGENYTKTVALDYVGDGSINYRFYAKDSSTYTELATGTPNSDSTVTVTNNAPTLAWTGETNYISDGVDPDSGANGSSFVFRVKYTDIEDTAPTSIQVWVDEDDLGSYDAGEKYDMTIDGGDGDYTNGELYAKTLSLSYAGNGVLTYRFYAYDGDDAATGTPTSNSTVTITNNVPVGGYTADNVIPAAQVTQSTSGDGIITINWKGHDDQSNNVTLNTFEYSVNGGADWNAPTNTDSSASLSTNWTDSDGAGTGYSTATTFGAATAHSFTFDTDHADVTGMDGVDQSDVQVRFTLNDGQDSAAPAVSESFQVDDLAPTDTMTSATYDEAADTLTIAGTNFTTIASATTDIKSYVDWTKLVWDINGDGATTADITFVVGDVTSLTVTSDTVLTLVFTSTKGTAIEATSGYGGGDDTLDVTAGFSIDVFGNVSTTDAVADASLSTTQTIGGTVYTDEGVTTIADGAIVRLVVNGSSIATDTTTSGAYSITLSFNTGDAVLVYLDGHATDGTSVTVTDGNTTDLDIYGGHLITRHDNSSSLTNALMNTAKGSYVDGEILYSISGSDMTTTATELYVPSSHTYAPGGTVTAVDVDINGTLTAAANAVNVSGSWDATGGVFTSTGTVTFNAASGTNTITPGGTDANHDFQNIVFNDAADSATFQLAGAIDVDGNFTVTDGIFNTTASNYAITVAGNFSQAAAGQVEANSSTITVTGDLSIDGTIDSSDFNNASFVMSGAGSSITFNNLSSSWSNGFYNLTVGQSGVTDTLNDTLMVHNMLTIGSGELTGNIEVFLGGSGDIFTFDPASNLTISKITFNSTNSINFPTLTNGYDCSFEIASDGVIIDQTGNITINGSNSLFINGYWQPSRAITYNTNGYDLNVGGDIRIGSMNNDTGLKTLNATNSNVSVGGLFMVYDVGSGDTQATFTSTGSTVTLNGTADQTVTSSGQTFNNLTLNNTGTSGSDDIIIADALDINGTLTITDGDLDISSNDPTVNTAGTVSIASAGSIDVTSRTANWTFDGTTTLTDSSSGQDFEDVVLNGTSLTLGSNMKVQTMTNTAGTLNLGSSDYILEIDGTGTPLSNSGTFTAGTSTVKYTGTTTATNITTLVYSSLQLAPTSSTTYSLTGHLTGGNALTADLTVDANAKLDTTSANNYGITVGGDFIQSATTSQLEANSSTITVTGNFTADGTVDSTDYNNASLVLTGAASNIDFNNLSSFWDNGFYNLTVGQSGVTDVLQDGLAIRNVLTVGSGNLTGASLYMKGSGDIFSFDAASNLSVAMVKFNAAAQNLPTLTNGYDTDLRLISNGANITQTGSVTLNSGKHLYVDGDGAASRLNTYNTGNYALTVGGDIVIGAGGDTALKNLNAGSSTITVSGDFTVNDVGGGTTQATFTAGTSTVLLNGTGQGINGSTTFYNLTKSVTSADTLTFEAGETTTIATGGTVTLNGASSQLLTLASSTTSAWNFNVSSGANKNISYVSVSYSDASGSDASHKPISPVNSVDGGNNIDWFSVNAPIGGYTANNVIPAAQVTQSTDGDGILTINWRGKDVNVDNVTLKTFQYSVNGGADWNAPTNGDSSGSLSTNWTDSDGGGTGYTTASDWTGTVHSFTFDTDHADVSGMASVDQSDVQVRFTLYDGSFNSIAPATSESVQVDDLVPSDTITSSDYDASTDTMTITGTNFTTIAVATTDIKSYVDWTKFVWDINGDDATTANITFVVGDVTSLTVTNATTLTLVFTSAKATAIEATAGYGTPGGLDKLDVTAGFSKDSVGNTATTDAAANAALSTGTVFVVTRGDDPTPGNCDVGDCSLREAIDAANANSDSNDITIDSGVTTVTIGISGTDDTNAAGDFDIIYSVNIYGNGSGSTTIQENALLANAVDRVFDVIATNSPTVLIQDVTVKNGKLANDGGCIRTGGNLTIKNSIVDSCTATSNDGGAIYSSAGSVTIDNSTVSNGNGLRGGGIFTTGLTITNGATIQDNYSTNYGAGIYNQTSDITMDGTVAFTNNDTQKSTSDNGGAIWSSGNISHTSGSITFTNNDALNGGAICMGDSSKTITMVNPTFDTNTVTASGGAIYGYGITITGGATFQNNYSGGKGGAIYNPSATDISIDGTILFNNNDTAKSTDDNGGAIWTSSNIYLNASTGASTFSNNDALNGGAIFMNDSTKAITMVNPTFTANTTTASGGAIYGYGITITGGATFQNNYSGGKGGAIYSPSAADISIDGTILFNNNDTGKSTDDNGGAIWAGGNLYLNATTGVSTFSNNDALNGGAIFMNDSTKAITMVNPTLDTNTAVASGGAIYGYGITITGGATVQDNYAGGAGGAICSNITTADVSIDGTILFDNNDTQASTNDHGGGIYAKGNVILNPTTGSSTFTNNSAQHGGAIYIDGTTKSLTISNGPTFTTNTATSTGGAIRASNITITGGATFNTNNSANHGGAIYNASGTVTINGDIDFNGNYTPNLDTGDYGGAIYSVGNITLNKGDGSVTVQFRNNTGYRGGAIYAPNVTLTAYKSILFTGNTSANNGGALYVGSVTMDNGVTVTNNVAGGNGGAFYIKGGSLTDVNFTNNRSTANDGGAIYTTTNPLTISGTNTFDSNYSGYSSSDFGGAIHSDANLTISNATFTSNNDGTADAQQGGAIYMNSGTLDLDTVSFANFYAATYGGAIVSEGGTFTDVTFTANHAGSDDGGAIRNTTAALTINGTSNTFSNNYTANGSADYGGNIFSSANLTVSNTAFTSNNDGTADAQVGGAIYMDTGATLDLSSVTFENFHAASSAGAVYTRGGTFTNVTFTGNHAGADDGGAIYANGVLIINGASNTFSNNYAANGSGDYGGTIYSNGNLTISDTTFTGNNDATADAQHGGAIFMNSGATLDLTDVSFANFYAATSGGAVYTRAGTFTRVTFTGNHAGAADGGAIYADGNLVITGASNTFSNNYAANGAGDYGGTIYSGSGTLAVSNTTFTGNNDATADAQYGGAIFMNTTSALTVTDSSFENFYTNLHAGAIYMKAGTITGSTFANNSTTGDGGAVYGTGAGIKYINSTFSANDAGSDGGAIYQGASCIIKNSTFYNNTATATADAIRGLTCTVANTIVTKTTSSSSLCTGVTSSDYNLQYNGTCFSAQANDQSGDPLLSALADNTGPTETHALTSGSPAIDNALGTMCVDADVNSVDQRGEARTTTCDIGSYEYTTAYITVCASGCDFTTINGAIDDSGTTDGDIIQVSDGTYSENINFDGKDITIQSANGAASTTIQGTGANAAVVIFSNGETSSAVLDGFTIDNQKADGGNDGNGGIKITSGASPTIQNSIIKGNDLSPWNAYGGGIYINGSGATIDNCTIGDAAVPNKAKSGAGIYALNSTFTVTNSTIKSNIATGDYGGAGIYLAGTSVLTLSKSFVLGNKTTSGNNLADGGGISITSGATATITNTVIAGNSANTAWQSDGGGIYNVGTLNLYFSTVADNFSYNHGGGLYAGGTENIDNSIIWGNSSDHGTANIYGSPTLYLTETSSDPLFVSRSVASRDAPTTNGNYALQSGSICIDTGDNTNAPSDDILGNPRQVNGTNDKGAYEYQ